MIETVVLTQAQKDLLAMDQANKAAYAAVKAALLTGRRNVWDNPHKITPQQMVAAMGTNAVAIFTASAVSAQLISQIDGVEFAVMPEGWDYTANPDGTVTLVEPT